MGLGNKKAFRNFTGRLALTLALALLFNAVFAVQGSMASANFPEKDQAQIENAFGGIAFICTADGHQGLDIEKYIELLNSSFQSVEKESSVKSLDSLLSTIASFDSSCGLVESSENLQGNDEQANFSTEKSLNPRAPPHSL